ncbi:acetolactate synthase catalytic subunit [Actinomadura sp. 7K507]|uniref:acetolactate synthase catalytic subunit n=1 Tax=Actinomadura sp. 7K507 TaxID=2530365 RepID=UPI0010459725|nr:acetolactate synthase catalytic subunit [Actinomadura sp. 7K507]TDC93074.1 acetolactate synthase catalytic subunit [Actinomadura sp. 7K507]
MTTVADVIAGALARHGVETILGQSNPTELMLAAERIGIRQILYRTENAGGAMADGFARISGRIGVVAAQNGPAAALLVAPMGEALKASIPMLVLVQEVPSGSRDRNAFQELDHFALFASVSNWTRRIDDPARVEDTIDQALTMANSGRPGPVVLLVPRDVLGKPAVPGRFARTADLGAFPLDRPRPDAAAVSRAAQLIAAARSPLVVAGGGVHGSGAVAELAALQEIAHLPVVTTNMGKGAVDESGPLSLGVAANLTGERGPAHFHLDLIGEADVVLLVGTRTNENGTEGWTLTSPDATYIHIDVDPLEVGRNYESLRLFGDARAALGDLTAALAETDLTARAARSEELRATIAAGRQQHFEAVTPLLESGETPIAPERLFAELGQLLDSDDIVVADASYSSFWIAAHLLAKRPGQRFLMPRGLAGLGWGLPLALGAKIAAPARRVIAIVGDGGFAHVWPELETALREHLPVTVVVLNNSVLGAQRHAENAVFGETTTGVEFDPVDHAAIATAVGATGVVVDHPDAIAPALRKALESGHTTVLDVIVDPDAYPPVRSFDAFTDRLNAPLHRAHARPATDSFK